MNAAAGEKANPATAAQAAQMPKAAAQKAEGLKATAQKADAAPSAAQTAPRYTPPAAEQTTTSAGTTPNTGTDPANPLGKEYAKSVAAAAKFDDKKLSFAFVFYNKEKNKGKTYKFDFMGREMNAKLDEGAVAKLEALFNTLSVTTGAECTLSDDPNVFDFEFINPFWGIHTTVARSADGIIIGKQKADKDTGIQIPLETPVSIKRQAIEGIKIRNSFNIKMFACLEGISLLMGIIFGLIIWGILGIAIWIGGTVYATRKSLYRTLSVNRRDGTAFKVQIGQGEPNDSNYNALVNAIFG